MSIEELPRPISFDDVQEGDRVRVSREMDGVTTAYEGTVTRVWNARIHLGTADSDCANVFTRNDFIQPTNPRYAFELTLLDRPVKRGPAWDAPMGSLWSDAKGNVYCRRHEKSDFAFVGLNWQARLHLMANEEGLIDLLVPFSPPSVDAELERLRSNVIKAAGAWSTLYSIPGHEQPEATSLYTAVRALDDHQAGAS